MRLFLQLLARILINALGIYLSARWISGFHFAGDWVQLVMLALILTILNLILKPILKLILSPLIILTLGAALLAVNALILYLLDIFSPALTIVGIPALLISAILFGLLNFIFHFVL